jgi:hypothetical protein
MSKFNEMEMGIKDTNDGNIVSEATVKFDVKSNGSVDASKS